MLGLSLPWLRDSLFPPVGMLPSSTCPPPPRAPGRAVKPPHNETSGVGPLGSRPEGRLWAGWPLGPEPVCGPLPGSIERARHLPGLRLGAAGSSRITVPVSLLLNRKRPVRRPPKTCEHPAPPAGAPRDSRPPTEFTMGKSAIRQSKLGSAAGGRWPPSASRRYLGEDRSSRERLG